MQSKQENLLSSVFAVLILVTVASFGALIGGALAGAVYRATQAQTQRETHQAAVDAGVGEWVVSREGKVFKWKTPIKTERN